MPAIANSSTTCVRSNILRTSYSEYKIPSTHQQFRMNECFFPTACRCASVATAVV